jgi:hypothetical protein
VTEQILCPRCTRPFIEGEGALSPSCLVHGEEIEICRSCLPPDRHEAEAGGPLRSWPILPFEEAEKR